MPGNAAAPIETVAPAGGPLVWAALSGGLGNQLFQWAAAQALALDWGEVAPVIDGRIFDRTPWRRAFLAVRGAAWQLFASGDAGFRYRMQNRQGELAGVGIVPQALPLPRPTVEELRMAWRSPELAEIAGRRVVRHAAELDRRRREPVLLAGWMQSESNFVHQAAAIRRLLGPAERVAPAIARWRDRLAAPGAAAVHVRRGDLLKRCNRAFALQSPRYYEEAAALVAARTGVEEFYVFTDDPGWVRDHLRLPGRTTLVSGGQATSPADDFQLMRLATHFVIANSTFSWWAAWLGERPESCIVAPGAWAAAGGRSPDLVPSRWMILDIPPVSLA